MTYNEETELLQLTRENNALLKALLRCVKRDEADDFVTNIVANILGNRIDWGAYYAQRS